MFYALGCKNFLLYNNISLFDNQAHRVAKDGPFHLCGNGRLRVEMTEKPARTGSKPDPTHAVWVKPRLDAWKKRILALIFNARLFLRHGSGHSTKNSKPDPVPAFLLSKKKERKI